DVGSPFDASEWTRDGPLPEISAMSAVGNHATAKPFALLWTRQLAGFARSILHIRKNRHDMRRLRELCDWQLADIGLSRDDLHYAGDCPAIIGDPTLRLDELVRRRNGIEAVARRVA